MTLLCRVAENLFWLSRYIERAVSIARVIDVTAHLELDAGDAGTPAVDFWIPLLGPTLANVAPDAPLPRPEDVRYFLAFDADNSNSLVSCVRNARNAARGVRESLSSEMWEQLNTTYLRLAEPKRLAELEDDLHAFSRQTRDSLLLVQGLAEITLAHDEVWQFLSLGMYLERADGLSRSLERESHLLTNDSTTEFGNDAVRWLAVLRSAGSSEAYSRYYSLRVQPVRVLEFLLLNPAFPQTLNFSVTAAWRALEAIAQENTMRSGPPLRALVRTRAALEHASIDEVLEQGLKEFLLRIRTNIADASDQIARAYFRYATEATQQHAVARAAQIMAAHQQ
ncbi:MAG: alpha-E domain-containing protein [Chloroflexi bacterium]|nr:alpha-E domain-containing protein [Chloroflexota bacterium]